MAHASTREKAILQMKKVRKMHTKRKLEESKKKQELGEEEYEALVNKRHEKSLKDRVQTVMWDYEHKQFSPGRIAELRTMLSARKKEIKDNEEKFSNKELKQIEGILYELSK